MTDAHPNPWNFHNTDKQLAAAASADQAVYYALSEIAMGAPLGGTCFLENKERKVKIHDFCGGPPLWEKEGILLAIPIWIRHAREGLIQQLAVADSAAMELKIFARTFRVLDLRSFDKNVIRGFDSPAYQRTLLDFNIDQEQVEKIIQLNK